MAFDLIIRGGKVVTPDGVKDLEIVVDGETIAEIAPSISGSAKETIDASGLHVFPGVIDPHVHFNEPGRTEWEGFATGSSALAAGGGTLFFDMPLNSSPPVLDAASFDLKLAAAKKNSYTDFGLWGGLTPGNLDQLEELAERGVVGFKAFMCDSGIEDFPRADDFTLRRGMQIAAEHGLIVAVHAENQDVTSRLAADAIAAGKTSARDYLESRPPIVEAEAIGRACMFAMETQCKLHIVHVSHWLGQCAVHSFRVGEDADVTCETCPHYLALTEDDIVGHNGASAKCAPPLRAEPDRVTMWQRLLDGSFAFVASDHSPSPPNLKQSANFFKNWGGIAGVQSTLSILLSGEPALSPEQIALLTASNVVDRFDIERKGRIEVGRDADLALVDVDARFELSRDKLLDRHKLSPYVGRTFRGVVRRTILRGRTIFADGKMCGEPRGKLITPNRTRANA